jgi:hypothetical protein
MSRVKGLQRDCGGPQAQTASENIGAVMAERLGLPGAVNKQKRINVDSQIQTIVSSVLAGKSNPVVRFPHNYYPIPYKKFAAALFKLGELHRTRGWKREQDALFAISELKYLRGIVLKKLGRMVLSRYHWNRIKEITEA